MIPPVNGPNPLVAIYQLFSILQPITESSGDQTPNGKNAYTVYHAVKSLLTPPNVKTSFDHTVKIIQSLKSIQESIEKIQMDAKALPHSTAEKARGEPNRLLTKEAAENRFIQKNQPSLPTRDPAPLKEQAAIQNKSLQFDLPKMVLGLIEQVKTSLSSFASSQMAVNDPMQASFREAAIRLMPIIEKFVAAIDKEIPPTTMKNQQPEVSTPKQVNNQSKPASSTLPARTHESVYIAPKITTPLPSVFTAIYAGKALLAIELQAAIAPIPTTTEGKPAPFALPYPVYISPSSIYSSAKRKKEKKKEEEEREEKEFYD